MSLSVLHYVEKLPYIELHFQLLCDYKTSNLYFLTESKSYDTHLKTHTDQQLIFVHIPVPCQCANTAIAGCDNNVCAIKYYHKYPVLVNVCPMVQYRWPIWFWHSKNHAPWYILIIKANKMHYFSKLFDKILYMFRRGPLSIIRSISTLYTRNRYLSC